MSRYIQPSVEETRELSRLLMPKSIDEIRAHLGEPVRVSGPSEQRRDYGSYVKVVSYVRTLEFIGVRPTIQRLRVLERTDGRVELEYWGYEVEGAAPEA